MGYGGQMLVPVDVEKSYETKAGDILGLHIQVPPPPKDHGFTQLA